MNVNSNCKIANHEPFKTSDKRVLSSEAKLIVALIKRQPQNRDDLCRSAGISQSNFYRIRRLLKNEGIMRENEKGYALWYHKELKSPWDRLKDKLGQFGGNLVDIGVEKCTLSDIRDPITGWRQKIYDTKSTIKGIMVLKGAFELKAAAGIHIPPEYAGVLLTSDSIGILDRIWWKRKVYEVKNIEEILDGYNLSYRSAQLVELVISE